MNFYKKMVHFTILLCIATSLFARVRTVQTTREFDQQLKKSQILMALLYDGGNKKNGKVDKEMNSFFRMYESVSSKKLYDDADIVFTKINIKIDELSLIARRYNIKQIPCFMLFIKGQPVKDQAGLLAQLVGFVSENELHAFIQQYCLSDINRLVQEKERNRKERFVKSQEESDPYFYPAVYYAPEYDFSWQKPLKYDSQGNEK